MAIIGIKMSCVPLEKFCFCSVVLLAFFICDNKKSILFQACNGRKSNNFCGESSYVSVLVVLLAILCLSALPQALLYSFYCCVLMFRVCGNQHNKFIANINKKVGREISGN